MIYVSSSRASSRRNAEDIGTIASPLLAARFLEVPAELVTHGRKQLLLKIGLAARAEALVERGRENGYGHGLVDGGFDCPSSLARIRHPALEARERGVLEQRGRREVQQPRGDHTASPPHLRDL